MKRSELKVGAVVAYIRPSHEPREVTVTAMEAKVYSRTYGGMRTSAAHVRVTSEGSGEYEVPIAHLFPDYPARKAEYEAREKARDDHDRRVLREERKAQHELAKAQLKRLRAVLTALGVTSEWNNGFDDYPRITVQSFEADVSPQRKYSRSFSTRWRPARLSRNARSEPAGEMYEERPEELARSEHRERFGSVHHRRGAAAWGKRA